MVLDVGRISPAYIGIGFFYFFHHLKIFPLWFKRDKLQNAIFWVALIIGIIGFCTFHWHAYKVHMFSSAVLNQWC
ncbi:MAG: hypothetical protein CM1200mP18_05260 [Gammaproteobacteria bacterium]|nr:MAG: hypothetical protein CM1200mP18_05260 [Gammaproteobacteria bacterium]